MHGNNRQATPSDRDLLRRYLRERDARCPGCRGVLAGMWAAECPTCGQSLKLCLQAAEPYLRPWVTLTAALALSAGVGLLLLVGSLAFGELPFSDDEPWAAAAAIFHVASIPLTIVAVLWRRRFIKRSAQAQWLVATLGATMAALAFAGLVPSFVL